MYLNAHSYFSLKYGTLPPRELVSQAVAMGIDRIALTDINSISGTFEFIKWCRQSGIQPVIGVEFRNHGELAYVCIARNLDGFAEINRFLSQYLMAGKDFPLKAPAFQHTYIIYPLSKLNHITLAEREFVGVRVSEVTQLWRYHDKVNPCQIVALQPITYTNKTGFNLHKILRCFAHNCLGTRLADHEIIRLDEYFLTPAQLNEAFHDWPHVLDNSRKLLESCTFDFDFTTPKNRKHYTLSEEDDAILLRKQALDGMKIRYGPHDKVALTRVENELKVIRQQGFTAYFLKTLDFVLHANVKKYLYIGRGSGANSIVAYCVGITDVDPIRLDLYFERFINPGRTNFPDFDLDFSWRDRDELTDYIFKRYGQEYVCLMATYVTYRDRKAFRELGKVFGLPKAEMDALIKDPGLVTVNETTRLIFKYASLLEDFPSHLSVHAGGILISEWPLFHYTALQLPRKGLPICQWDMYTAEEIGFAKFDILSQRGLGHIGEAVELILKNRQVYIDIHRIQDFIRDERVRQLLQAAQTIGCFYVESPAMQQLILKTRCADYLTLVAVSSVIRPGVAESGMMDEYIRRHHNPASYVAIHPLLQEILKETYGVMIYQEDVLKVVHFFAGLTLAEADALRRGMSGKYRSKEEFNRIKEKYFTNCRERGYPEGVIQEVWRQIESFASYSFSKAHSASFAVESYMSMFLKAYFPVEFMCAVINNGGGFYRKELYVHEARRLGAVIEAPDILHSDLLCTVEGNTIWLGLGLIDKLGESLVQEIMRQRQIQPFANFEDFCSRVPAGIEHLKLLIRAGVFRSFGIGKKELLWYAHMLVNSYNYHEGVPQVFDLEEADWQLPPLWHEPIEDSYDEIELLGFSLCSPFSMLPDPVKGIMSRQIPEQQGRIVAITGYFVKDKDVWTKNGKKMAFGYFIDAEGNYFHTTHFPPALEKYPLRGSGIYQMEGKCVVEYGAPSLEVRKLKRLPFRPDPRGAGEPSYSGHYLN